VNKPSKNFDLNLVRVLVQIHADRNVSLAAENLDMSQPAVSNALRRLRHITGDKLFIPTARGMQPTPLADLIAPQLTASLAGIADAMSNGVTFNAATSHRQFAIAMTDIGEFHFLPRLLQVLQLEAPAVSIETLRNTAVNLRFEMEQGKVDLALGHLPDLSTDFHQRLLFRQRYMCLVRKGHPLDKDNMSLDEYAAAEHALVLSAGTGHGRVDTLIDAAGVKRRVRIRLPHFVALADIVESSDLVATVPEIFARRSTRHFNVAYRQHPVDLPPVDIHLFWHTKYHRDPANIWMREIITREAAGDDLLHQI
jgi:DNA-binding transcriptional LysR family regulator